MRALRILVNNIELDHVREDMKIKEQNNSFSNSISVAHNTRPVRIVENKNAVAALGEFSIHAATKKRFFKCLVIRGAIRYNGILTQLDKIEGFRKCDLKYGSEINDVMDKKIASFIPDFNVKGWDFFPAYTEESRGPHNAGQEWLEFDQTIRGKIYPEVKWQFPQLDYKEKFGTDLSPDDSHYDYRGKINKRYIGLLASNIFENTTEINTVSNQNVIAPQVFMLSPLYYAFNSIGYKLIGSIPSSQFFKRLLLLSFNDNMTKIVQSIKGIPVDIDTPIWDRQLILGVLAYPNFTYIKLQDIVITSEGDFRVKYFFNMDFPAEQKHIFGIQCYFDNDRKGSFHNDRKGEYDGELNFSVSAAQVGQSVSIVFHSLLRILPTEYDIEVIKNEPDLDFYDTHPTIDFSRYIPDWTTVEYLNNFQNLFNWKIEVDDVEKTVRIDQNGQDYLLNGPIHVIRKSLKIEGLNNIEAESYVLKYDNKDDDFQFISSDLIQDNLEPNENTSVLETKFKYIPHRSGTSDLSKNLEDRAGVGLMIYDPSYEPNTSPEYQGLNLKITGDGGIFNTHWKAWTLFRLSALNLVLKGPFTQTELFQIGKTKKLYVDHQLYLVNSIEYEENSAALFETSIHVEAVTF